MLAHQILCLAEQQPYTVASVGVDGRQLPISPLNVRTAEDVASAIRRYWAQDVPLQSFLEAAGPASVTLLRDGLDVTEAAIPTTNGWVTTTAACSVMNADEAHKLREEMCRYRRQ